MFNYNVFFNKIPEEFVDTLETFTSSSVSRTDYDGLVNASVTNFFSFYTPVKITAAMAADLEKFVLHYFILRRIGCGNRSKWVQMFRNKWRSIIPYYERLLETQENESNYFTDPISTGKWRREGEGNDHANESGKETNRFLDTPQGNASRIWESDGQGGVRLNDTYLTDIRGITDSRARTAGNDFWETKSGYEGKSPVELMKEYRDSFMRIYEDIAAELEELFFSLAELEDFV